LLFVSSLMVIVGCWGFVAGIFSTGRAFYALY
jgi:hypothetical protein